MTQFTDSKPNWIHFFDGELFRRYQDFARTRDFSQVLLTLREGITAKEIPKWPQQEITLAQSVQTLELSNYKVGEDSDTVSANYTTESTEQWRTQRRKRTRTFIVLGILIICLVALLVALLFHFHSSKSLFGSGSSSTGFANHATKRPAPLTRRPVVSSNTSPSTTTTTTSSPTKSSTTTQETSASTILAFGKPLLPVSLSPTPLSTDEAAW